LSASSRADGFVAIFQVIFKILFFKKKSCGVNTKVALLANALSQLVLHEHFEVLACLTSSNPNFAQMQSFSRSFAFMQSLGR
jgi:hypothetical protein